MAEGVGFVRLRGVSTTTCSGINCNTQVGDPATPGLIPPIFILKMFFGKCPTGV